MSKRQGRDPNSIRPVQVEPGFHRLSEGSVLYRAGGTVVLVTASIDETVPEFMRGSNRGWVTAEYQMHPRANPQRREPREGRNKPISGRSQEIQRLIGRSLRSALQLNRLGERTIALDADVLEADGGTRTASITGAWIAVVLALAKLRRDGKLLVPVVRDQVAAVSVGHVDGRLALDLCYAEDSTARVDLTVVATARQAIVEVQGTAEGEAVPRAEIDSMIDLALQGIARLHRVQSDALKDLGVDVEALMIPRGGA
ncbi:MAG: ribonuclease PH [Deltaproteobacteria bacterium]|nr:ribonuclease PH [Deltaproteobacteria bacterium]